MTNTLPLGVRAPEISPLQPFRVGVIGPDELSPAQANTLRQLFEKILRVSNFTVVVDARCQQTIRMAREFADVTRLILEDIAPWKRSRQSASREEILYNAALQRCGERTLYRDRYPERVKQPTERKPPRKNIDTLPGKVTSIHIGQQVTRLTGSQSSLYQQYGIDIGHNGSSQLLASQLHVALLTSLSDALILFNCPRISRILGDLNEHVSGGARHFPHCLIVGLEEYSAQAIGILWGISEENKQPWYHIAPEEVITESVAAALTDYLLFGEEIFGEKKPPSKETRKRGRHATPEQIEQYRKNLDRLKREQRGAVGQAQGLVEIIKRNALKRYFGG